MEPEELTPSIDPIDPQIVIIARDMTKLRHDFHQYPETAYEEDYAHGKIRDLLDEWELPYEVMAQTGIVVTLEGLENTSKKVIGLRADMDALSVTELCDVPWKSRNEGKMHACGHDGHMATLLTALSYLKDNRTFNGTVKIIFQPAEEGQDGAKKMIEEGLIKSHKIGAMYGFHNWPDIPIGKAAIHTGPVMASNTNFEITLQGKGCHGAMPEQGHNPIPIAFELGQKLGVVRDECALINPDEKLVLSLCSIQAGNSTAMNIIPGDTKMTGTVRSYNLENMSILLERITEATQAIESAHDIPTRVNFLHSTCPTVNNREKAELSLEAMKMVIGEENIEWDAKPAMTAEDFGEFSSIIPVSYIWIGNADPEDGKSPHSQPLHNSGYGFNDNIIPIGAQYFVNIIKTEMPMSEGWNPDAPPSRVSRVKNSIRTRFAQAWEWLKTKLSFSFWKKK
jgi:hippurate hydrolase